MPRALLLTPPIFDFSAFDLWAFPLGLQRIAAILREGGWEVDWLDATDRHHPALEGWRGRERDFGEGRYPATEVRKPAAIAWIPRRYKRYGIPEDLLETAFASLPRPDVILLTSRMTYWYPGVVETITRCRRHFPGVPIALGGIYASLVTRHARAVCGADVVVTGEGEPQLDGLLRRLTQWGLDRPDGRPPATGAKLDDLPRPAWDLQSSARAIAVETTRGCPFHCTYCSSRELVPKYRRHSVARVVDDLEFAASKLGTRDVAFYDDALLTAPQQHFLPLARGVIERELPLRFHTPNSLFTSEISAEVAEAMRAMGVETVRISLESTRIERLESWNRRIYPSHFESAMSNLRAAGFSQEQIGVYVLCGLPGQSVEEVREAVDFVLDRGATPRIAEYSPIPMTQEWGRAAAQTPEIDEEPLLQNNSVYFRVSKAIAAEELDALKRRVWERVRGREPAKGSQADGGIRA